MSRLNEDRRLARRKPTAKSSSAVGCAIAITLLAVLSARAGEGANSSEALKFNRDIRPILADHCFKCHGPDAKQRKGKLQLDLEKSAKAPAASRSVAIVPGKF